MSILATAILFYFFVRYTAFTVAAIYDRQILGAIVTGVLTASLLVPMAMVWS